MAGASPRAWSGEDGADVPPAEEGDTVGFAEDRCRLAGLSLVGDRESALRFRPVPSGCPWP
jgi:hypothetical protein